MYASRPTGLIIVERKPLEGWLQHDAGGLWLPAVGANPTDWLSFVDETHIVNNLEESLLDVMLYGRGGRARTFRATTAELAPEPERERFVREAWDEEQPGQWLNVYETVHGDLRFRCCHNLFVDGEHTPWCPKQPDRHMGGW